jgi:carbon starvation protein
MFMSALFLIAAVIIFVGFYFVVGRLLDRKVVCANGECRTPAHRLRDGVDYVPANRYVLFGHHFASIAGAAPIIGPVIAMVWGWLPGLLWVWFGNVCIGAVHDYLALMASVRYDGKSIQWVAGEVMTHRTRYAFSVFIFMVLVLVVAAFAAVIGHVFVDKPHVPTAEIILLANAVAFGVLLYRLKLNFALATVIGLVFLAVGIGVGFYLPLALSYRTWMLILLIYVVVAASIPVNILLQPRDYLNAWLLVFGLLLGSVSLLVGHFAFDFPAFTAFSAPVVNAGGKLIAGPFWPVIPLIIACGSLSGFHSLVGSGTTSKQLASESDGLFVGCGAMLTEGFLSTIVILMVACFALDVAGSANALSGGLRELSAAEFSRGYLAFMKQEGGPIGLFAKCYGHAAGEALALSKKFVTLVAALWCSAFAMTTLDTTNRIARYTWTELLQPVARWSQKAHDVLTYRWVGALVPALLGILLAWSGKYSIIWPAFGGANQMLASIALLTSCLWVIKHLQSRGGKLILLPALALWITVTAALLWYLWRVVPTFTAASTIQGIALGIIVAVMIALNLLLLFDFVRRFRKKST